LVISILNYCWRTYRFWNVWKNKCNNSHAKDCNVHQLKYIVGLSWFTIWQTTKCITFFVLYHSIVCWKDYYTSTPKLHFKYTHLCFTLGTYGGPWNISTPLHPWLVFNPLFISRVFAVGRRWKCCVNWTTLSLQRYMRCMKHFAKLSTSPTVLSNIFLYSPTLIQMHIPTPTNFQRRLVRNISLHGCVHKYFLRLLHTHKVEDKGIRPEAFQMKHGKV